MSWITGLLRPAPTDPRSGRLVFLVECLLNQNARDRGAAERPAATREVVDMLTNADIGMAQIQCPEIACLGFERTRARGQSIRQALQAPSCAACCRRLAAQVADRIQTYSDQGYRIIAVLGGNAQSPACAVHVEDGGHLLLTQDSGVFTLALAGELQERGLRIPLRGMRDANDDELATDLNWLGARIAEANA